MVVLWVIWLLLVHKGNEALTIRGCRSRQTNNWLITPNKSRRDAVDNGCLLFVAPFDAGNTGTKTVHYCLRTDLKMRDDTCRPSGCHLKVHNHSTVLTCANERKIEMLLEIYSIRWLPGILHGFVRWATVQSQFVVIANAGICSWQVPSCWNIYFILLFNCFNFLLRIKIDLSHSRSHRGGSLHEAERRKETQTKWVKDWCCKARDTPFLS